MDSTVTPGILSLEQLPAELRNEIYQLVLQHGSEFTIAFHLSSRNRGPYVRSKSAGCGLTDLRMRCQRSERNILAITSVSKRTCSEALPVFFACNRFALELQPSVGDDIKYCISRMTTMTDRIRSTTAYDWSAACDLVVDLGWRFMNDVTHCLQFTSDAQDIAQTIVQATDSLKISRDVVKVRIKLGWAYNHEARWWQMSNSSELCNHEGSRYAYGMLYLMVPMRFALMQNKEDQPPTSNSSHADSATRHVSQQFDDALERLLAHPEHDGCYIHRHSDRLTSHLSDVKRAIEELAQHWASDLLR